MATERDMDLLDDYVANRLQGEEKSAFEKKLQSDPDLQSEFQMQQRMVKVIRDTRAAELKTMLQNTPVPPVNYGTSVMTKFAAGAVVAGIVATGVYFYFENKTEESKVSEQTTIRTDSITEEQDSNVSSTPTDTQEAAPLTPAVTPKQEKIADSSVEAKAAEESRPVLDVYDPSEETESKTEEIEEPAGARRSNATRTAPAITVEVEKNNRSYSFNYQFKDSMLILYGPFEKNLYEILEFFSQDKRTVFLYYKNNYYLLEEKDEKIRNLTAITDPALINKLKESQKK